MKKVILLLGLLAVLVAAPAYAEEGGEGAKAPEFVYYQVPMMVLPVVTSKGVTQQVSLSISLELSPGDKEDVEAYGPRLVDAYISNLYGAMGDGQMMIHGKNILDIAQLKTKLTAVTEKVLGNDKSKMHALFLQAVQQNQI